MKELTHEEFERINQEAIEEALKAALMDMYYDVFS